MILPSSGAGLGFVQNEPGLTAISYSRFIGGKLSTACLYSSDYKTVEVTGRRGSTGSVQLAELPDIRNLLTRLLDDPLATSALLTSDDIAHSLS